jgi:hypothetical protein
VKKGYSCHTKRDGTDAQMYDKKKSNYGRCGSWNHKKMCVRTPTAMRRGVLNPHQRQAMVGEQKVQTVHCRSLNLSSQPYGRKDLEEQQNKCGILKCFFITQDV